VWGWVDGPEGISGFEGRDHIKLTQEDWITVLRDSDYAETLLIEVVVPDVAGESSLRESVRYLTRAKDRLLEMNGAEEAVAACRPALEALGRETIAPPRTVQIQCSESRSFEGLTLSERRALARWALHLLTHPAHHPNEAGYSRAEAEMIIQMSAAVISCEVRSRANPSH
jgi:hypothetical protein